MITKKVLLIDDEPFALKLLEHQLSNLGLNEIQTFNKAPDALNALETQPGNVDLIFCDLQMPEMDGVEFVRHLARIGYSGALVLISGHNLRVLQTAQRLAEAQHINILGVINKPPNPEQLLDCLDTPSSSTSSRPGTQNPVEPADIERAIKIGELINYYQPKVAMRTGELVGVEALARWRRPSDGLVYPDQFISVAEDSGLMDALTQNVLKRALQQTRLWLDQGLDLHIAVNVSMDNLDNLDFADQVIALASAAKVQPSKIVLEITESRLMNDLVAPLDILTRLRLRDVGLSIDDFGTGHSSMAKLHDFPFSELKIDRSFVHQAYSDDSLKSIVEASVNMAQRFDMTTVAEGIEDREDWDYLRQAGCDVAQGFFIGKPMPAQALPSWLQNWAALRKTLIKMP